MNVERDGNYLWTCFSDNTGCLKFCLDIITNVYFTEAGLSKNAVKSNVSQLIKNKFKLFICFTCIILFITHNFQTNISPKYNCKHIVLLIQLTEVRFSLWNSCIRFLSSFVGIADADLL